MHFDSIQTAHVASNADVFPRVVSLHLDKGDRVADVTYGNGVFWENVPDGYFDLFGTDINPAKSPLGMAVDCRYLPYDADVFDSVVLDPPYSSGFYKEVNQKASNGGAYTAFHDSYSSAETAWSDDIHPEAKSARKRHARVLDIYYRSIEEAWRVLNDSGVLIVKCQDEVSDNLNYFTHTELMDFAEDVGFTTIDLFVVVRPNEVRSPNDNQHVALKNHSYFLVFDVEGGSLRG